MGNLIYSAIASADGYIEDEDGRFEWAEPDEEVFRFVNELARPAGTHLYGRRMYETLLYWETADAIPDMPDYIREWTRLWQAADKIVFSTTLESTSSARTRLERDFDPGLVRRLKSDAERDISVGGSALAGQALGAGLVDEVQLILMPVAVGGGKPVFPRGLHVKLELLETRRFAGGAVFLRYLPKN